MLGTCVKGAMAIFNSFNEVTKRRSRSNKGKRLLDICMISFDLQNLKMYFMGVDGTLSHFTCPVKEVLHSYIELHPKLCRDPILFKLDL